MTRRVAGRGDALGWKSREVNHFSSIVGRECGLLAALLMHPTMFPRAFGPLALGLAALAAAAAPLAANEAGQEFVAPAGPLADPAPVPPWLLPEPAPVLGLVPNFEEQVIELVNIERLLDGQRPPLKGQVQLAEAAELHSTNMGVRNFFSHCDPDTGTSPGQRVTATGYNWNSVGENAAAGQATPEAVMTAWMNSSGHAANILSLNYREIGVGYFSDGGDAANVRLDLDSNCVAEGTGGPFFRYWTQDFGRRSDVYPVVIDREAFSTSGVDVDLYVYGTGWAQEMRFRNSSSGTFTAWEPFAPDKPWTLGSCGGVKTVIAEIRNGSLVRSAIDSIVLDLPICLIFGDGFENGDTSAWTSTTP